MSSESDNPTTGTDGAPSTSNTGTSSNESKPTAPRKPAARTAKSGSASSARKPAARKTSSPSSSSSAGKAQAGAKTPAKPRPGSKPARTVKPRTGAKPANAARTNAVRASAAARKAAEAAQQAESGEIEIADTEIREHETSTVENVAGETTTVADHSAADSDASDEASDDAETSEATEPEVTAPADSNEVADSTDEPADTEPADAEPADAVDSAEAAEPAADAEPDAEKPVAAASKKSSGDRKARASRKTKASRAAASAAAADDESAAEPDDSRADDGAAAELAADATTGSVATTPRTPKTRTPRTAKARSTRAPRNRSSDTLSPIGAPIPIEFDALDEAISLAPPRPIIPTVIRETGDVVLEISGLVKKFGSNTAVDGVDLQVRQGSFYGLVGPNGAGKTTTLSMITGLLRPDAGTITVDGVDVWQDPTTAKQTIGVLPDRLRLFDRLTGGQLLHYSGTLRGLDNKTVRERSAELASAFGIEDALGRLVADYSVGMTKKIALAASLIHSPKILVLDEPFESVDPVSAQTVSDILQRYVDGGGSVILSSHSMEMIERICDSVAIIVHGQVLSKGTVDEVRQNGTLEERFVELAGDSKATEGLEWLLSSSN